MFKKDFSLAVIIGVLTALVWLPIIGTIVSGSLYLLSVWSYLFGNLSPSVIAVGFVLFVTLGFTAGIYIAQLLSKWKQFFLPFARFAMVGFLNTGIDLGIFNLLISLTSIEKGKEIILFKAAGFILALINGYFWNKYWTFQAGGTRDGQDEFLRYIIVSVLGLVINVSIAGLIVNYISPLGGVSQLLWDNFAAIVATIANLFWNFVGYKLVVFRKR